MKDVEYKQPSTTKISFCVSAKYRKQTKTDSFKICMNHREVNKRRKIRVDLFINKKLASFVNITDHMKTHETKNL